MLGSGASTTRTCETGTQVCVVAAAGYGRWLTCILVPHYCLLGFLLLMYVLPWQAAGTLIAPSKAPYTDVLFACAA